MGDHETVYRSSMYRAFLVRFWRDKPGSPWRASAQSVHTGEIVRFASVPLLLQYLHAHLGHDTKGDDSEVEAFT
ncbi:MAG: hypothetical protein ACK2U9_15840 [Anaerolineae bacterium]